MYNFNQYLFVQIGTLDTYVFLLPLIAITSTFDNAKNLPIYKFIRQIQILYIEW
jgi:hypothetical protein